MFTLFAEIETGAVIVAVTLIAFVGVIFIIAMIRYPKIEDVLKIWGALGTVLGLIVGSFGTYFFTKDQVKQAVATAEANKVAVVAQKDASLSEAEAEKLAVIAQKEAISSEKKALEESLIVSKANVGVLTTQLAKAEANQSPKWMTLPNYPSWDRGPIQGMYPLHESMQNLDNVRLSLELFSHVDSLEDKSEQKRFRETLQNISKIRDQTTRNELFAGLIIASANADASGRNKALELIAKKVDEATKDNATIEKVSPPDNGDEPAEEKTPGEEKSSSQEEKSEQGK